MNLSDDDRFQQAVGAAQAIVRQCLTHAERASARLPERVENAAAASVHGRDMAALRQHLYPTALRQRINIVEALSNGVVSQLRGLDLLMKSDTFLPIPAVSIVRSIAESAATVSWLLRAEVAVDERAVRSYSTLFRTLETAILGTAPDDSARLTNYREVLVRQVEKEGARVVRKARGSAESSVVAQVTIQKAHAKVEFNQTQRIAQEIPTMGTLYSALSGIAHGEQMHLATTWKTPDSLARLIGRVCQWSVQGWSRAVHEWVGVSYGPFINRDDLRRVLATTPSMDVSGFGEPLLDV